jgi:hypothetical protein
MRAAAPLAARVLMDDSQAREPSAQKSPTDSFAELSVQDLQGKCQGAVQGLTLREPAWALKRQSIP